MIERAIEIVRAGALTTVQDAGRIGWAHLGVPRSGALDPAALRLANRLVGNPDEAAGLETTMTGCAFRTTAAVTIAVTGAPAAVTIEQPGAAPRGATQRGAAPSGATQRSATPRGVDQGQPIPVRAGALVTVGPAYAGVRCYLAFGGGIDVAAVLGSRATDTLSGLGPPTLRDGDTLPLGPPIGEPSPVDVAPLATIHHDIVLRVRYGPRLDRFGNGTVAALVATAYTVSPLGNRVGVRLIGAPLRRTDAGELPSEGIVLGAVQVPADGQPLVFLADHPTTGGYPVIGVVHPADLALLAQVRPGDRVRFRWI